MERQRVTVQEAARILGVKEPAIRKRIKRGTLQGEKVGNRVFVYLDMELSRGQPTGHSEERSLERDELSTVMEVLTAYVRENAPWPPTSESVEQEGAERDAAPLPQPPRTDIQAVLEVLKRREEDRVPEKHRVPLDLRRTDLRGANLREGHLKRAVFIEAHLEDAHLDKAHLEGAFLGGAHLEGAFLGGAYLERAIDLTPEQIQWTYGGDETELPEYLHDHRPLVWSKSIEEQKKIIEGRLKQESNDE